MFCPFTTKDAKVHEGKSTSLSEIEGGFLPGHISAGKHGTASGQRTEGLDQRATARGRRTHRDFLRADP